MFGTNLLCCCSLVVVLLAAVVKVNSSRLSSGKEAEKLCQAYKKVCPRGKVCAIQTLEWPRVMKFPVCVHKNFVKARSEVCEQAPAPGGCSAQFRRWYYNVHMAACSWFTYGGCGGNDNNFRSREECERICVTGLQDNGQVTRGTTEVYRRRDEQLYPRHPHHQNPHPSPGRSNGRSNWQRTTATATTSHYNNRRHHHRHRDANRHRGINTDSNLGAMDNSRFDVYGRPYVYTTPGPTTQSVWSGNADDNRSNRTPLEHRVAPVEHRAIHAARGRPAALHARPLSLAAVSRAPDSHANNNRRLTDLPESGRGLTDVPEKNRRLTDLPDSRRGLNTNERLAGLAVQMPRLPTVNIRRRVSGSGRRAHPSRPLRLNARPALLARAPLHASAATDITPGLTSPLEASYAADANETIRKFPTRPPRQRKRGRGQKRRNRRRRRKNRKRGRKNLRRKPQKQHTTSGGSFTVYDNDTRNANSTRDQALRDLSSQFEEFRQKKATFWPEKTQNDAAEFLVDSKSFQERIQREGKKSRRRRRRRRRRKGHGKKRRQRGRKRERNQSQVESTAAKAFQGSNQYYEKIHLFGVLDNGHNATDPMT